MPRKEFESFTRLDASDVNTFLMDQTVMTFAGTAARGSALPTPTEGMVTYLEDSDTFEFFDGTAYEPFGGAPAPVEFDFLIIAGGGGGGSGEVNVTADLAGGGGAGGYRSSITNTGGSAAPESPMTLPAGTYTLKVGAGGAGAASGNTGSAGITSFFGIINSIGGGGGGGDDKPGGAGGSSGGSSFVSGNPIQGVFGLLGQGSKSGGSTSRTVCGGGGGAGANGGTSAGGAGLSNSITGSSVTRGGGGGGSASGAGGTGGGGAGAAGTSNNAVAGTVNTGGGGGGGPHSGSGNGAAGGSGIVILKYPDTVTLTIGVGLTSSTTTSGGFNITSFTAGEDEVSF